MDQDLSHETWVPIIRWGDRYEVSTHGRVRSLRTGAVMALQTTIKGYLIVGLTRNRASWTARVHRLVASAFLEKPDGADLVNHKDGNKQNNRVENLEWCDASHNQRHALAMGLSRMPCVKGERHPRSKLTGADVREIRTAAAAGERKAELARKYGIRHDTVCQIVSGVRWRHIPLAGESA